MLFFRSKRVELDCKEAERDYEFDKDNDTVASVSLNQYSGQHPPGIEHSNSLCFFNSILQTFSRTPRLLEYIDNALNRGLISTLDSKQLNFLRETYIVFCLLTKRSSETNMGKELFFDHEVKTAGLRKAISELCIMVVDPESGRQQNQQDASKFLTCLLNILDDILVTSTHIPTSKTIVIDFLSSIIILEFETVFF